jgi:hypothetical protein
MRCSSKKGMVVALQCKSGEGWRPPTLGSGQMESTKDEEGADVLLEQRSESRAKRGERGSISILRRQAGEWHNVHGGFAPAERRGGGVQPDVRQRTRMCDRVA